MPNEERLNAMERKQREIEEKLHQLHLEILRILIHLGLQPQGSNP